eukprot:scaffold5613_cov133-Isochrysis_galbana.AAC.13
MELHTSAPYNRAVPRIRPQLSAVPGHRAMSRTRRTHAVRIDGMRLALTLRQKGGHGAAPNLGHHRPALPARPGPPADQKQADQKHNGEAHKYTGDHGASHGHEVLSGGGPADVQLRVVARPAPVGVSRQHTARHAPREADPAAPFRPLPIRSTRLHKTGPALGMGARDGVEDVIGVPKIQPDQAAAVHLQSQRAACRKQVVA